MVFERKLKGGLHGYANYEKSYWYGYIRLNKPVPVKKKPILKYLILSSIYCLYLGDGGNEGGLSISECSPISILVIRCKH